VLPRRPPSFLILLVFDFSLLALLCAFVTVERASAAFAPLAVVAALELLLLPLAFGLCRSSFCCSWTCRCCTFYAPNLLPAATFLVPAVASVPNQD